MLFVGFVQLVLRVDPVEFGNHLVELLKVLNLVVPPRFVGLDLPQLQNSLSEVCMDKGLLLSANIFEST